jgi:excisionase family DNA binding protein
MQMVKRVTRSTRFEELPDFLTVEEARTYLGLGRSTLYELLRCKELPCVRFGRVIRVPRSAIEQYALKSEQHPVGRPGAAM